MALGIIFWVIDRFRLANDYDQSTEGEAES
jgi:hypothetical protein